MALRSATSLSYFSRCLNHLNQSFGRAKVHRAMATMQLGGNFQDPELQTFLQDVHKIIVDDALVAGTDRNNKVVDFQQPSDLEKLLNLPIGDKPTDHGQLLDLCRDVIKYSVKTGHPAFHNQLFGGLNAYGIAGSWVTEALNTNIHTYEVSPAFVVIEKYLVEKLCSFIGFQNGDGTFCPGGSFANIMSVNCARFKACPNFKTQGIRGLKPLKVYTSQEAHYSINKGAVFLGMGSDSVVKVLTDERGRMIPEELEKQIKADLEKGEQPLCVNATSGTTVLGAYDDLDAIADICAKYNVWMHVDACWGGAALVSEKHKHKMHGINRVDSVAWNLHKMTSAPIQCSALLVKEPGVLEAANSFKAEYLFQPDKNYDTSYDVGDKTVQCGRKPDCLKLWLMWKAMGDQGMTAVVDNAFDNARYLTEKIRDTPGFKLVIPEFECTNVCFWYIPESLRGQEETEDWWKKVSKVAPKIKAEMMTQGTLMTGYQPLSVKGFVNFFRLIIGNSKCNHSDMDFIVSEIDRLGRDL